MKIRISLAAARVNAGMTQQEVADYMHTSKKTIINWEKGRIRPSFSDVSMLSKLYNIPEDYIFLPIEST